MDKRFFLALFLSLIVIALSQLLFPPAKPVTVPSARTATDSSGDASKAASSTQPSVASVPIAPPSQTRAATTASEVEATVTARDYGDRYAESDLQIQQYRCGTRLYRDA